MSQVAASIGHTVIAGPGAAPRILIVDDEPYMCDVCTRTLQRGGYQVVATSDPHKAERILHSDEHFDLLLTDIKMPSMSGLDLALIAHERDPAIAIIIMTGFATMENLQQSVQRGIADFLSKPFELDHLRLAVDQALRKRAILQDNLRLQALEQLLESSKALNTTLELAGVAEILLRVTLQQSEYRTGFVLMMEDRASAPTIVPASASSKLLAAGGQLAQRSFDEQQTLTGEAEAFCHIDGIELNQALALPLHAQGQVNGVLLLCTDQTATLRPGVLEGVTLLANHAGAALRNAALYGKLDQAYQHVQDLDRLKSEFISIASHELRTPLSIVLGYTMMVRDQSAAEQRQYLDRVMDSAQRIKSIVDDMVSLRHLETGETQFAPTRVVVQDLVAHAIERVRPSAAEHAQSIHADMSEQPIEFACDRDKVLLILGHLLSNALRFSLDGSQIVVRAELRAAGSLERSGRYLAPSRTTTITPWVVIEVQDNGIGIAEHEQPLIFDRFYQVANSLTRDHGGTGLGLALVRELVGMLGGAVWVESQQGQGSTFGFALPYRQEIARGEGDRIPPK